MEFPEGMSVFLCSSEKAQVLYLYIEYFTEKALTFPRYLLRHSPALESEIYKYCILI